MLLGPETTIAQRLVRRVCPSCAEPTRPSDEQIAAFKLSAADVAGETYRIGRGCDHCDETGYKGRMGTHELMSADGRVGEQLVAGGNTAAFFGSNGVVVNLSSGLQALSNFELGSAAADLIGSFQIGAGQVLVAPPTSSPTALSMRCSRFFPSATCSSPTSTRCSSTLGYSPSSTATGRP